MDWLTQKFELRRGDGHNDRAMEGLRGFAVFLVFVVHYVTLVSPWIQHNTAMRAFADSLHTIGNTGVDLFFVLSGYLIYGSLISRPQGILRFLSRRIERIYPAFIAVFVIYVVLSFAFPSESKIPQATSSAAVYLIQNFLLLPGLFPIEPMIAVAWSLSYEMFYYLAIPLLILLLKLRKRSRVWRTAFFVVVGSTTVAFFALNGGPIRLIMFIAGILLYEAMDSRQVSTPSSSVGLLALCVGLLGTLLPLEGSWGVAVKMPLLFLGFFVLCLACFQPPEGWLARAFSWTPARWLGNMSYSYYLLHGLALKAAFLLLSKLVPPDMVNGIAFFWALFPVMFCATLVPTAALFLAIERPLSLTPPKKAAAASSGTTNPAPLSTP